MSLLLRALVWHTEAINGNAKENMVCCRLPPYPWLRQKPENQNIQQRIATFVQTFKIGFLSASRITGVMSPAGVAAAEMSEASVLLEKHSSIYQQKIHPRSD
eukprot:766454-Hanusia_phi.AAC.2